MDGGARAEIVQRLVEVFGAATDVSPAPEQPLHVLIPAVDVPPPWEPRTARALTRWENWPNERPQFWIDISVRGESGEPPRSHTDEYLLGETWRAFSYTFAWNGTQDPVIAVQMWMNRFVTEAS